MNDLTLLMASQDVMAGCSFGKCTNKKEGHTDLIHYLHVAQLPTVQFASAHDSNVSHHSISLFVCF